MNTIARNLLIAVAFGWTFVAGRAWEYASWPALAICLVPLVGVLYAIHVLDQDAADAERAHYERLDYYRAKAEQERRAYYQKRFARLEAKVNQP
ncbi:hypothetical protein [Trueperella bialowiezensis]|uniref:Uncharacterized protein n=1 Tax=Trueperella bialowiezensis TaxID=312285 RepID=A0A3S4X5Q6_9ACTO|nr:hypothetical protein [Trueperella bialowiezensis]VEI13245.1 Uncharacterised protein [Trueperella bialowiezensis]